VNTGLLAVPVFEPAPAVPQLGHAEIHLWFFPHWNEPPPAAESSGVRDRLARYLGIAGTDLRIQRDARGKPRLVDAPLDFNVSHTGSALLLGVRNGGSVGVDLEAAQRRTRPVLPLARRWFAPDEARVLESFPADRRQTEFLTLWTAKEALVKARGLGIGEGLRGAIFQASATGWDCVDPDWQVLSLVPAPGFVAAVAWQGPVSRVGAFVAPTIAPQAYSG
jgi:4'-phosphopantetheinyl transferase